MAEKVADFYGLLGMRVDQGSFDTASRVLSTVKTAIAAFVGFKAVQGIVGAVGDVVEMGGQLNDASIKTGVAAETLQEYAFVAGQAGGNLEQVVGALGKLNKGLGEVAATGKGPAADALRELGIGLTDPIIKAGDLDAILLATARKFEKTSSAATKTRIAIGLFGKSGVDMIPVLSQGAAGIEEMKKKARDLGVVIDNEGVRSLDDFGDSVGEVQAGWQGIKNQATLAILPLLKDLMPGLISAMKDAVSWVKEHKTEIREFVSTIGRAIKYVVQAIVAVVGFLARGFKTLGTAIGQAVGWIVTKAIAIGQAFSDAFAFAKGVAQALWNAMVTVGTAIVDTFIAVGSGIVNAFKAAFDWVINKAKEVGNTIRNLPVIKQLGDAGAWIGGKLATDVNSGFEMTKSSWEENHPGQTFTEDMYKNLNKGSTSATTTPITPPPNVMPTTGAPVSSNVDVGGIKIDVHGAPGQDVKQLAALVGDAVDERMSQVFRHAQDDEGVA